MESAAVVRFPDAPLTESLVRTALASLGNGAVAVVDTLDAAAAAGRSSHHRRILQWATYDLLDHARTLHEPGAVLASSYTIRKALIRKHYLHRTLSAFCATHPASVLSSSTGSSGGGGALPRTWDIDIAWADELDDLFVDELWDLAEELDGGGSEPPKWYILKAGMADRGVGIRLFESKDALRAIFEEFDEKSDSDEDAEGEPKGDQDLVTSQLRHFVIQEYLANPLLIDPTDTPTRDGFKFHLRAYCIASGALTLYLWSHILALFASARYVPPFRNEDGNVNLTPHLTNTSLQIDRGEMGVRLLSELEASRILSGPGDATLSASDIAYITDQTAEVLAETFRAALASTVNFQPLPNAFELFGADLLVSHGSQGFQVHLLELNAEPAIELTGPRLHWVLQDMFKAIAKVCAGPFFGLEGCRWDDWKVGETKEGLRKCLEVQVRGPGAW